MWFVVQVRWLHHHADFNLSWVSEFVSKISRKYWTKILLFLVGFLNTMQECIVGWLILLGRASNDVDEGTVDTCIDTQCHAWKLRSGLTGIFSSALYCSKAWLSPVKFSIWANFGGRNGVPYPNMVRCHNATEKKEWGSPLFTALLSHRDRFLHRDRKVKICICRSSERK